MSATLKNVKKKVKINIFWNFYYIILGNLLIRKFIENNWKWWFLHWNHSFWLFSGKNKIMFIILVIQMISGYEITHSHDSKYSVGDLIRGYPDNQINAGDISLKSKMYRCRRGVIG